MQEFLSDYNSTDWADGFINELSKENQNEQLKGPPPVEPTKKSIDLLTQRILAAHPERIAIFLDYDGTLTPIRPRPEEATISAHELEVVKELANYPWLDLVIVSGRDGKFMSAQFEGLNVHLAAEHGAKVYSPVLKKWRKRVLRSRESWYPAALKIMSDYAARVPHSQVEKKQFSIAWHYRLAPQEFADFQAKKLVEELEVGLANLPVNVLRGKKVIEIRAMEADKGVFARTFLEDSIYDTFAIALGDDMTDEDLFKSIRGRGVSFKIGTGASAADVAIHSQSKVTEFLLALTRSLDTEIRRPRAAVLTEVSPAISIASH
ncbi:MAG: trehalose-phosphatase [Bdellovibrionota bacterium]